MFLRMIYFTIYVKLNDDFYTYCKIQNLVKVPSLR